MSKKKHSTKPWDAPNGSNSLPSSLDITTTSTNIPPSTTSILTTNPYCPTTTSPYYTTTTTAPAYPPHWMEKEYHEYIAHKGQFEKFRELREEFQKYLALKDAFEEYLEDYNSKIAVPVTLDI